MLAKEICGSAVCFFPFGFRCSIFLLTVHLPLSWVRCGLDSSPLKVIKKPLPSCVQRPCLLKQAFENRVRKITLSVKTLSLRCGDNSPALLPRGGLLPAFLDPQLSWGACQMGHSLWARGGLHSCGVPQVCPASSLPSAPKEVKAYTPVGQEWGHRRACTCHWLESADRVGVGLYMSLFQVRLCVRALRPHSTALQACRQAQHKA